MSTFVHKPKITLTSYNNYIQISDIPSLTLEISSSFLSSRKSLFPLFRISLLDANGYFQDFSPLYIGLPFTLTIDFGDAFSGIIDSKLNKVLFDFNVNLILESFDVKITSYEKPSPTDQYQVYDLFLYPETRYSKNINFFKAFNLENPMHKDGYSPQPLSSILMNILSGFRFGKGTVNVDPSLSNITYNFINLGETEEKYLLNLFNNYKFPKDDFYTCFVDFRGNVYAGALNYLHNLKKSLPISKNFIVSDESYVNNLIYGYNKQNNITFENILRTISSSTDLPSTTLSKEFSSLNSSIGSSRASRRTFNVYMDPTYSIQSTESIYFINKGSIPKYIMNNTFLKVSTKLRPDITLGDVVHLKIYKKSELFVEFVPESKESSYSGEYMVAEVVHKISNNVTDLSSNYTTMTLIRLQNPEGLNDNLYAINL